MEGNADVRQKDHQSRSEQRAQASVVSGYVLVRSRRRRRTMSLRIDHQGRVVIRAPMHSAKHDIDRFFEQSRIWVLKKLAERQAIQTMYRQKIFVPGEEFLFLGKSYPLRLGETNGKTAVLAFCSDGFLLPGNHADKARELFIKWYKRMALEKITERVFELGRRLNLVPQGIRLMTARTQWGSCSPDNRLSFNWKLVMASDVFIDYVVAHELLHIKEKNHSSRFWKALEAFMPDYKERKTWLDDNAHMLNI
jgi:predicted metal-dependent hydrolase